MIERAARCAYEWDAATDRVTRIGDGGPDDARIRALAASLTPANPEAIVEECAGDRWLQDSARAEFDAAGRLLRVRGFVVDVTPRRHAEARLALIARVSELIAAIDDPADLLYEVARAAGEHLIARRCLFTEIDLEHDRGVVRRDYCRGVSSVAGVYRVSDYAETTRREMQAGRIVVNCDAKYDSRTAADYEKTYAMHGERAYVAVPLLRDGRWVAELWISDDVPRQWSDEDVAVLQSVAERAWTAIEKLRVNAALRESESRMQFVSARAEVGYWYWDIPGDTLLWSGTCYRLHGVAEGEEISYARYLQALHPADRAAVDLAVRSALEHGERTEFDIECRTVWPDGTVRWVQGRGSATFEGGVPVRMAGIALDITRRKTLELEREEMFAMERRLRAQADEASRAKDHFLALLSHELRTPMTTILGWASFIRSGMPNPATTQKGIESIEQASRTQSRLIDDLLDVSRIVAGKMALDRKLFDVADVVRGAIEVIRPHAVAITITHDLGTEPAFVTGDAMRLQQVIWNLLSNAVKFTPAGGHVSVELAQTQDAVEIRVRDSGVGIEPHFLPHVFERFRQAEDGPTRRFGGLGLGLSIVRHLTEAHGGSVSASSEGAGRGAEFTVRLPRAMAATTLDGPRDADALVGPHALDGVRVLLVDDDPSAREVLSTILSGYGALVTSAASAADAIRDFAAARPDVLVSDIGMPEEDGYALIGRLRVTSAIPAVAVTAYADPRDRDRALMAGYQAHLAKPIEPHALAAAVLRVLPRADVRSRNN